MMTLKPSYLLSSLTVPDLELLVKVAARKEDEIV
jgi:hypothetical protein